jgi:hypothetical protein
MSYPGVVAPTPASTCRQSLQDLMFCAIQSITDLNAGAARHQRSLNSGSLSEGGHRVLHHAALKGSFNHPAPRRPRKCPHH